MISSISGFSSLNQSNMIQMRQQMFSRIDTNGDGKHDKDELAAMAANGPQGAPGVDEILEKFDTDGDGAVSKAEFEAGQPQGSGSVRASSDFEDEDELLEALLEALNNEETTTESVTDESDTTTNIAQMLSAAIKSYTQSGMSTYSQSEIASLISSELYA